ncbi:MAG TPA: hypothetical protein DGT23_32315 [Micromonosporaceae bacterium]|nr:hypothetical protein [Micromonosporaceae bacterium]
MPIEDPHDPAGFGKLWCGSVFHHVAEMRGEDDVLARPRLHQVLQRCFQWLGITSVGIQEVSSTGLWHSHISHDGRERRSLRSETRAQARVNTVSRISVPVRR